MSIQRMLIAVAALLTVGMFAALPELLSGGSEERVSPILLDDEGRDRKREHDRKAEGGNRKHKATKKESQGAPPPQPTPSQPGSAPSAPAPSPSPPPSSAPPSEPSPASPAPPAPAPPAGEDDDGLDDDGLDGDDGDD